MGAVYDASYHPDSRLDSVAVESHRRSAAFIHPQSDLPRYEVSQLSNSDEDEDMSCDLEPTEYSPTAIASGGASSLIYNLSYGAGNLVRSAAQAGTRLFYQQRQCVQLGEGPTLLRLLCFLGGFVMLTSSFLSTVNIFSLLSSPSTYVLQMYQGYFGIVTMIVEAKNWECFDHFKPWMTEWFRFLTVPAGKGAFYLFVGSLGVSLWIRNFFSFLVGLYMSFMGVVCIAVHAGTNWKPNAYDHDQIYGSQSQREDPLTNVFHDAENGTLEYEGQEEHNNSMPLHPDTTTTSSVHSIASGGKNNKHRQNGKRYVTESSSLSTIPMNPY